MCLLTNSLHFADNIKGCTVESEDLPKKYITRVYHCGELMVEFVAQAGGIHWNIPNNDWYDLLRKVNSDDKEMSRIQAIRNSNRFKLNGKFLLHAE